MITVIMCAKLHQNGEGLPQYTAVLLGKLFKDNLRVRK